MTRAPLGLLALNLGGPHAMADVRPFLQRLFADREIIRFPGGALGQRWISGLVVRTRLAAVLRNYASIGGGSPIYQLTVAQVGGVARRLADRLGRPCRPYIAFRYTKPSSEEALRAMAADGVEDVVALTLYPQYSAATTGSSLRELDRAMARTGLSGRFRIRTVDRWSDDAGYLDVLAGRVRLALEAWPEPRRRRVVLLFSAHSLPMSFVEDGDPYPAQVAATVQAVVRRLGADAPPYCALGYQSQTGPVRWLEPRTEHLLRRLGHEGVRDVLVVPVSFVSDHIETLYEVDQLFAAAARAAGITTFRRIPSLNDDPQFLDALADIALGALREPLAEEAAQCVSA
jgi:ferrochelatase